MEKVMRHILLTTCPQFTNEYGQPQTQLKYIKKQQQQNQDNKTQLNCDL